MSAELRAHLQKTAIEDQNLVTLTSITFHIDIDLNTAKKELWNFYKDNINDLNGSFLLHYVDGSKVVSEFVSSHNIQTILSDKEKKNIIDMALYAIRSKQASPIEAYEIMNADSLGKINIITSLSQQMRELNLQERLADTPPASVQASRQSSTVSNGSSLSLKKKEPVKAAPVSSKQNIESETKSAAKTQAPVSTKDSMVIENEPKEPVKESENKNKKDTSKNLKRKAPATKDKPTEIKTENESSKRTKAEDNKTRLDKDPEYNDLLYQPKPVNSNDLVDEDEEEESYFGEKVVAKPTTKKEPKVEEKQANTNKNKTVKKVEPKPSYVASKSVESVASSEPNNTQTTTDQDEPVDDGKPKMVKKIRKVLVVKEERNERGYLVKKDTYEEEEYWEQEKPKPITAANTGVGTKSKSGARERNQSSLTSFFKKN